MNHFPFGPDTSMKFAEGAPPGQAITDSGFQAEQRAKLVKELDELLATMKRVGSTENIRAIVSIMRTDGNVVKEKAEKKPEALTFAEKVQHAARDAIAARYSHVKAAAGALSLEARLGMLPPASQR